MATIKKGQKTKAPVFDIASRNRADDVCRLDATIQALSRESIFVIVLKILGIFLFIQRCKSHVNILTFIRITSNGTCFS